MNGNSNLVCKPIGIIRTPHKESKGTPIQPHKARGIKGTVELLPEYTPALKDLEGFERIWLLFWCNRAKESALQVVPYLGKEERGLFATRAPSRLNPIGMSCVRLLEINQNRIQVSDVDLLDNTPILDIKPYVPSCDSYPDAKVGWLEQFKGPNTNNMADDRFEKNGKNTKKEDS